MTVLRGLQRFHAAAGSVPSKIKTCFSIVSSAVSFLSSFSVSGADVAWTKNSDDRHSSASTEKVQKPAHRSGSVGFVRRASSGLRFEGLSQSSIWGPSPIFLVAELLAFVASSFEVGKGTFEWFPVTESGIDRVDVQVRVAERTGNSVSQGGPCRGRRPQPAPNRDRTASRNKWGHASRRMAPLALYLRTPLPISARLPPFRGTSSQRQLHTPVGTRSADRRPDRGGHRSSG